MPRIVLGGNDDVSDLTSESGSPRTKGRGSRRDGSGSPRTKGRGSRREGRDAASQYVVTSAMREKVDEEFNARRVEVTKMTEDEVEKWWRERRLPELEKEWDEKKRRGSRKVRQKLEGEKEKEKGVEMIITNNLKIIEKAMCT